MNAKKRLIQISGHRGYRAGEIDNTKRAFQKAIDLGLDYVEFDVRKTSDDVAVIFHDRNLNALTNGSGSFEDKSWNQIKRLRYNDGQKFQSLREMLDQCAHKINLMLEIKSDGISEQVMECVKDYGIEESVLIQSFKPHHVRNCYELNDDSRIKWGLCIGPVNLLGRFGEFIRLDRIVSRLYFSKFIDPHPFVEYLNVDGPIITDYFMEMAIGRDLKAMLGAKKTWEYLNKIEDWDIRILNCDDPAYCVNELREHFPEQYELSDGLKL